MAFIDFADREEDTSNKTQATVRNELGDPITPDAGDQARDKVTARASKVKRTLAQIYFSFTSLVILLVAGLVWYFYQTMTGISPVVTDTRPCYFQDEAKGIELTGRRHYTYPQKSLFGIDFRDTRHVTHTTELDVRGTSMNVVGLKTDGWWGVYIGEGEKGIQMLENASVLVFTLGKKNVVINDKDFCK